MVVSRVATVFRAIISGQDCNGGKEIILPYVILLQLEYDSESMKKDFYSINGKQTCVYNSRHIRDKPFV